MLAWRGRLVLLLVAALVTIRLGDMAVLQSFYSPGPLSATRDVVVPSGGTKKAATVLNRNGVIRYPLVFRITAWATRKQGPLHAGEFIIPARASITEIFAILRHGLPVQHHVTIPEGLTGTQIEKILNTAPAASGSVAAPLNGAVLPQTYDYTLGTSRAAILARAEKAMSKALAPAWAARDPALPLATPQQALVLASIVQQESPVAAELPEIAAVYENRLAMGMKLQADPTVLFAASGGQTSGGAAISRAELGDPSPYNTYVHAGLPPGPICSPGTAAIEAVLHPASSKALYFVATGNGGHVFADNFAMQIHNISLYRARRK